MSSLIKAGRVFYATGINYYNIDGKGKSIHAEMDAINNLKHSYKEKKVDLFVFRTNKCGNTLSMSKPCCNCMNNMHYGMERKGYKLRRIYYIDFQGNLCKI